mmetsp:Transcript_39260/g.59913  ORF Transcript_39260/g.59913 Transcript_39260/m.59913 type:complete len:204 (-) Transcript_39260:252-863(-)
MARTWLILVLKLTHLLLSSSISLRRRAFCASSSVPSIIGSPLSSSKGVALQKLVLGSNSVTWNLRLDRLSTKVMLFFFTIEISIPMAPEALRLLFLVKCTPSTFRIDLRSLSYLVRKSLMYLFWVNGNLENGKMGLLNFRVYIFMEPSLSSSDDNWLSLPFRASSSSLDSCSDTLFSSSSMLACSASISSEDGSEGALEEDSS